LRSVSFPLLQISMKEPFSYYKRQIAYAEAVLRVHLLEYSTQRRHEVSEAKAASLCMTIMTPRISTRSYCYHSHALYFSTHIFHLSNPAILHPLVTVHQAPTSCSRPISASDANSWHPIVFCVVSELDDANHTSPRATSRIFPSIDFVAFLVVCWKAI
jgi:hypothetical protein